MKRLVILALVASAAAPAAASPLEIVREHVVDDVWHYSLLVPVGEGPNGAIRIHRVVRERRPWFPRPTPHAVMLLHGDFSSFVTNFLPAGGLAEYLASRDIDVWGVTRRWALAPEEADLAGFEAMGIVQEVQDTQIALAFARATRLVTGSGLERLTLGGFSRGGHLAYVVASVDAARPSGQRQVKALVPIDVYAAIDPADGDLLANACIGRDLEQEVVDAGIVDSDNFFQIELGELALTDPDGPSPNPRFTNLGRMQNFVGRTWLFFAPTPDYHLAGGRLVNGFIAELRFSSDETIAAWLADASPHQPWAESLDFSKLLCNGGPLPIDAPLSRIEVPLFLLAAQGGYGAHALYSTTQVASTDVTALVVSAPGLADREQFGHADLLFAADAPALAWEPLAAWIRSH